MTRWDPFREALGRGRGRVEPEQTEPLAEPSLDGGVRTTPWRPPTFTDELHDAVYEHRWPYGR